MLRTYPILMVAATLLLAPMLATGQESLRDPTRPYNVKPVAPTTSSGNTTSSFRVTAIFTSEMRRVAVVNGRRVSEGDQVDGAKYCRGNPDR